MNEGSSVGLWYGFMLGGVLMLWLVLGFWPTLVALLVLGYVPIAAAPYARRKRRQ